MNTIILSERLLLRPFLPEDEIAAIRLLTNPDFMVYSPSGALTEVSARERFNELCESYRRFGFSKFAVFLRDSPILLGYCGVEQCEIDGALQVELGFRLHSAYRGQGYATESGRAFLEWHHNSYQKPVIAFTEPSNKPSICVLEKLGFQQFSESKFGGMSVIVFRRIIN
jgi:Acetyltransferases, including N-acetylases of ribosomal proteins